MEEGSAGTRKLEQRRVCPSAAGARKEKKKSAHNPRFSAVLGGGRRNPARSSARSKGAAAAAAPPRAMRGSGGSQGRPATERERRELGLPLPRARPTTFSRCLVPPRAPGARACGSAGPQPLRRTRRERAVAAAARGRRTARESPTAARSSSLITASRTPTPRASCVAQRRLGSRVFRGRTRALRAPVCTARAALQIRRDRPHKAEAKGGLTSLVYWPNILCVCVCVCVCVYPLALCCGGRLVRPPRAGHTNACALRRCT